MTFELRDHTADVAVEATAESLGAVFADVAAGLTAAMCENPPTSEERFSIEERAESREALLFDYLDRLIYERDVRGVLPVEFDCSARSDGEEWIAEASVGAVPLSAVTARDVKAVTYSEMELIERDGGWYAYVVFDV